ncbi:MAG: valine--tRNA ligase [Chloroflexi bacterium]|nr:valine--tRNA ligase [Chloroflexota bacterium]
MSAQDIHQTSTAPGRGEIAKAYDPQQVEDRLYRLWMERGYFTPRIVPGKQPFVIIMPPPNVTGELHMGHALTATLEDIMVRWHRMKGDPTLWLPGIDHAGIAAQVVVERQLAKEGLTRHQLGREKFLDRMWQWMRKYGHIIADQHQKLGASCDWSRERFTLDQGPSRAVRTTFVRLFHKGLIYRGERIINWCPRCATAISDLEVEHKEVAGHLYYVNYPLSGAVGHITVATTRPETILGDTAVAVNPNDPRFQGLVGQRAVLPVIGREIPIIADEAVDTAFGTGAVKITPAHDPVDFEVAQRHSLPSVNILNPNATMNQNAGPYQGLDRSACRQAILEDLKRQGLLVKIEPHTHAVGHCERCKTVVEPWTSKQWFVKTAPLARPAIDAVIDRRITIIPEHFTRVYLNWMENIRDWCISRQLWWGHRIPVWYCDDCGELTVSMTDPSHCQHCQSARISQDPDVLDTWFSSALWPHSTLGWPDDTEDFRYFYPTSVMETGYDILFFWVARMIMMGLENTGQVPFRAVYLHGLIRDEAGQKMSKLRGNVVSPLEVMKEYGTDALRFALTTGTSPGNDLRLSPQRLESSRNFANKLWNAARFVTRSLAQPAPAASADSSGVPVEDRWIVSRLNRLLDNVAKLMESYQFGEAQRHIHDFIWGEFCDWYIELAKLRLRTPAAASPLPVLSQVLETSLRLLHPFMPFVTEEIWQYLRPYLPQEHSQSIMVAPYPQADTAAFDTEVERQMEAVIEVIRAIRNARSQLRIEPARWLEARIHSQQAAGVMQDQAQAIESLARARPVTVSQERHQRRDGDNALVLVLGQAEVVLPLEGVVDLEAERKRLEQEIEAARADIARLERRLADAQFLSKAPADVVEREKQRLSASQARLSRLEAELAQIR